MDEKTRLTELRIVSQGRVEPLEQEDESVELGFREVAQKWADVQDRVRGLPWSKVPEGMLRDYIRVVASGFSGTYGGQGQRKALEVLTVTMAKRGLTRAKIGAAWSQAGARVDIQMQVREHDAQRPATPGVEFTLEGPQADEQDIRKALRAVAEDDTQERLVLDPIAMVPEPDLRRLVADMEDLLGGNADDDHTATLLAAASVLVVWQHMEKLNAQTSEVVMSGLFANGQEVLEGQEVVLTSTLVALDRKVGPKTADPDGAVQVSTVKLPRH